MPELQQLRVDVFQDLHRSFGARGGVINQRGIPSHHEQVVGIVGKAGLENVIVFPAREWSELAAQYLRNLRTVLGQKVGAARLAGDAAQCEDVIIFAEPIAVGTHQGGCDTIEPAANGCTSVSQSASNSNSNRTLMTP